jgi:hypothetical protein
LLRKVSPIDSPRRDLECISSHNEALGAIGKLDLEAVMILAVVNTDNFGCITSLQHRGDVPGLNIVLGF